MGVPINARYWSDNLSRIKPPGNSWCVDNAGICKCYPFIEPYSMSDDQKLWCPSCYGTGNYRQGAEDSSPLECEVCEGTGQIAEQPKNTKPELLPCPFCGGKPDVFMGCRAFRCESCNKNGGWMSQKDWNNRSTPACIVDDVTSQRLHTATQKLLARIAELEARPTDGWIKIEDYQELKSFIQRITMVLQKNRNTDTASWDRWFQEAYKLYVKHDVENKYALPKPPKE